MSKIKLAKKIDPIPQKTKIITEKRTYDPTPKFKWWQWIKKAKYSPDDVKSLLINMELNTGFVDSFFIIEDNKSFEYKGSLYVIDLAMKYWHIPSRYYALDYHQSFALPIKRHINVEDMQTAIEETGVYDSETATNPTTLKQFLSSNIIEQVVKGAELSKWLMAFRIMIFVILIMSAVNLLIGFLLIFIGVKGGAAP